MIQDPRWGASPFGSIGAGGRPTGTSKGPGGALGMLLKTWRTWPSVGFRGSLTLQHGYRNRRSRLLPAVHLLHWSSKSGARRARPPAVLEEGVVGPMFR